MGGEGDFKGRTRGTGSAQRQFINRTTPYYHDQRPPQTAASHFIVHSHQQCLPRIAVGGEERVEGVRLREDGREGSPRIVETIPAEVYDSSESHYSLGRYIL